MLVEEEEDDVVFVDVVVVFADRRAADGEDPAPTGRALSMDSVPATTRYTVPAALATRSAVFFNLLIEHICTHNIITQYLILGKGRGRGLSRGT